MVDKNLDDPYVQKPTLNAEGKKWVQRCFVCLKSINFIQDPRGDLWMSVGPYVRHRKCYPVTLR